MQIQQVNSNKIKVQQCNIIQKQAKLMNQLVVSSNGKNNNNISKVNANPSTKRSTLTQTQKTYTQFIFQDDYSFRNVKIKGKSLQSNFSANNSHIGNSKSNQNGTHIQRRVHTSNNPQQPIKMHKTQITSVYEPKNSLRNSIIKNRQQHCLLSKWVYNTSKIIKTEEKKQNNKCGKKSITVESVEKLQKQSNNSNGNTTFNNNGNGNRCVRSGLKKYNQTNSDKVFNNTFTSNIQTNFQLQYQNQNKRSFDEQTHCNFRQIIQEFNLAKKQIKETKRQQQKQQLMQQQKKENKKLKIYKKPNFYQYQQFFRQNYQAKQLKQTMFLFKKSSYLSNSNNKNNSKWNNNQQYRKTQHKYWMRQGSQNICENQNENQDENSNKDENTNNQLGMQRHKYHNINFKKSKKLGVIVYQEQKNQKMLELAQKNFQSLIALQPYLQVKTHQFSKTQRKVLKRKQHNHMNKTSLNYNKKSFQGEFEKLQPWSSNDHGQSHF